MLDWTATFNVERPAHLLGQRRLGHPEGRALRDRPERGQTNDAVWYGLALGTQFTFTEKTSLAIRGEWLRDADGYRIVVGNNTSAYSLTGTLAYKLTPNLLTRLEARYDGLTTTGASDNVFFPKGTTSGASSTDLQGLVQVAYIFD